MPTSRRSEPLPPGWSSIRRRVLRAYDYRCAECDEPANHVDHIVAAIEGGTDDLSNLQALCGPCHDAKTGREAARRRYRNPVARPAEPHPGMVEE
jgi:5-methylcytosine-specific restriction protein A